MDSWQPMAEDYRNPAFNSYSRGPAAGLLGHEPANGQQGVNRTKVHVSGLPIEMTSEGLKSLFSQVANVTNAYVLNPKPGQSFKMGFVALASVSDVEKAITKMNGHRVKNYNLRVNIARERQPDSHSEYHSRDRDASRQSGRGDRSDRGETEGMNGHGSISPKPSSSESRGMNNANTGGARPKTNEEPQKQNGSATPSTTPSTPQNSMPSMPSPMGGMGNANCEECHRLWTMLYAHWQHHNTPNADHSGTRRSPSPTKSNSDAVNRNLFNGSTDSGGRGDGKSGHLEARSPRSNQPQQQQQKPYSPSPSHSKRDSPARDNPRFQQSSGGSAFSRPSPKSRGPNTNQTVPAPVQREENAAAATTPGASPSPEKNQMKKGGADVKPCEACGKAGNKHCSKCGITYCSVQCQKGDWKKHKSRCKPNNPSDQNENEASLSQTPGQFVAKDLSYITPIREKQIKVMLIYVSNPGSLWVQPAEKTYAKDFQRLMAMIKTQVETCGPLKNPKPQEVCLALYDEDDQWYRATIQTVSPNGRATVLMIDFGNTEDIAVENLRPVNADIMSIPVMGVQCSLAGVEPRGTSGKWCPESKRVMEEIAASQQILVAGILGMNGSIHQVDLKLNDQSGTVSVGDLLIKKELAWPKGANKPQRKVLMMSALKQTQLPAQGTTFRIVINNFISPREFYCQPLTESSSQTLAKFSEDLNTTISAQSSPSQFTPKIGEVCAGQFTADETWYRAFVKAQKPSGEVVVEYIDYGNMEQVNTSRLRPLPPKFHNFPRQSFVASFADLPEGDISEELSQATVQCLTQCSEGFYNATIAQQVNGTAFLTVADPTNQVDIAQAAGLVSMVVRHKVADLPSQVIPLNQEINVMVTEVKSPAEFYGMPHTKENAQLLQNITVGVTEIGSQPADPSFKPKVGELCCAQFSEDKSWYRAAVLKEYPNKEYELQYVDYGNGERVTLDLVRPITQELASLPRQSVGCCLAGLPRGDVSGNGEVTDTLKQMTYMGNKPVLARVVEQRNGTCYVELEDVSTGLNISQEIIALMKEAEVAPSGPSSLSSNPSHGAARGGSMQQPQVRPQARPQVQSPPQAQAQSTPPAMSPEKIRSLEEQLMLLQAQLQQAKGSSI